MAMVNPNPLIVLIKCSNLSKSFCDGSILSLIIICFCEIGETGLDKISFSISSDSMSCNRIDFRS